MLMNFFLSHKPFEMTLVVANPERWSDHPLRRAARRWTVCDVWHKNRYSANLL